MVSVAVSTLGRSRLVFIDPGVKINGTYYRDVLLSQLLLPVIRNLAPEGCFVFQEDSAPAHRAKETIEMLTRDARLHFFHIMASEQPRFESCRLQSVERDARPSLPDNNP